MSQPPVKADGDLVAETLQLLRGIQTGAKVEPDVFTLPLGATDEIASVLVKWDTHFIDEIDKHQEKARNYRDLREKSLEPWISPTPLFDRPASPAKKKDPDADTGEIAEGGPVVVRHLHLVSQGEERVALALLRDLNAEPKLRDNLARGWWRLVDDWLLIAGHPSVRSSDELAKELIQAGYLAIEVLPEDFAPTESAAQFVALTERGTALLEHVPEGPVFFPDLTIADEAWARRLLVDIASEVDLAIDAYSTEDWSGFEQRLQEAGKPEQPATEVLVKQLIHDGMLKELSQTDQSGEVYGCFELTEKGDEVFGWLLNLKHDEPLRELQMHEDDRHLAGRILLALHLRPDEDSLASVAEEFPTPLGLLRSIQGQLESAGFVQGTELTVRGAVAAKRILALLQAPDTAASEVDPDQAEDASVTRLAHALGVDNALARIGVAILVARAAGTGKVDAIKAVAEEFGRTQTHVREVFDRLEVAQLLNRVGVTPAGREFLPVQEPGPAEPPADQTAGGPVAFCEAEEPPVTATILEDGIPEEETLPF